jgi:cation transport ATPase
MKEFTFTVTRIEALEILGLNPDASLSEAREAYRTLAKTYHPDKNAASNAAVMFRIITDAWEFIQKDIAQEHAEAKVKRRQAEEEAARKQAEEESARRRTEAEAQRKRAEKARQQAEAKAASAEELNRRKKKETEDKIWLRSYAVWFIICLIYSCIGIIGNWLGMSGFGSESWGIGDIFSVFLGSLVLASILGSITGGVIVKVRKWFK